MRTIQSSTTRYGKGWILVALLFMGLLAIPGTLMAQEEMILIRSTDFEKHQRPPVRFYHDMHNEKAEIEDCSVCHHVYEDGKPLEGESSEDEPCSSCHPAQPEPGEMGLMRAYHKRCITCHDQVGKGPQACGSCHVKS